MRERLAGCLGKGGQLLHRAVSNQPYRSHRLLHSAFWAHGAGDIDLPSWWLSLLQLPQAKHEEDAGRGNAGPWFLDFLYPSRTLAFIRKYAITDPAVLKRHQRIRKVHQRAREYASIAADDVGQFQGSAALEAEMTKHETQIERFAKEISSTDVVRREALLLQLDELLLHDDPNAKHLPLWRTYLELGDLSVPLLPRQLVRMMRCLSRSTASNDQERLIDVFDSIPVSDRRSIHYSYVVFAALRLDRLELAVRLHKVALDRIQGSVGTSALLRYTIQRNIWQVAIETWQGYLDKRGRAPWSSENLDIWDSVDAFSLPDLWEKASSALDFAYRIQELAGDLAVASARSFALQLAAQSLSLGNAKTAYVDEVETVFRPYTEDGKDINRPTSPYQPGFIARLHPNVDIHEEMMNKAIGLQGPSKQLYTTAISQVLTFKTRKFDALALKYYRALRELADYTPSMATVVAMLRRLCSIHSSAGIFMVLNDFRFYFGDIPSNLLELIIPEFAHQGNRTAVADLLREYHGKVPVIENSHVANAILYVCNRRGETKNLPDIFQSLHRDYKFEPDLKSWKTVVATYARVGDVDEATKWFNEFLDSNIKPDSRIFIYMMSMFAKRGDLDAVQQLLRQSADLGVSTEIGMIDCLVLAQIHNGDLHNAGKLVEEALNTVEDVPQRSRTRMWNYLLNAHALRGDLEKVTILHRRMRENKILSDGTTFAALLQSLVVTDRTRGAFQILRQIMPQAGVRPTALHYGLVMSSWLRRKWYRKIFNLYSEMLKNEVKPTMSTQNYIVRAAALKDVEERAEAAENNDQVNHKRAQQTIDQALADMDPMDLATREPVRFVGNLRLDDAFQSSYMAYMVNIYGRERSLDKATEMYDRYIEKRRQVDMDDDTSPPINMLSALMVASQNAQDYDTVSKCWHLSLEKAQILACRQKAIISEPGWVLPPRRYILNTHLRLYVNSLVAQHRFAEVDETIDHLHRCGYVLDSRSWNQYIIVLLQGGQRLKAFELCEQELMPGWEGWARLGPIYSSTMRKNTQRKQSKHLQPHRRHPQYDTMVHLAAAFVNAQSESRDRWGRTGIDRLVKVAPRTVNAVYNLPRLDDFTQRTVLQNA